MDIKRTSLVLVSVLAGASAAQASNISVVSIGGNHVTNDAVSQFVGFMVNDESVAIKVSDSGAIRAESGSQNGVMTLADGDFDFNGSEVSKMLIDENRSQISLGGSSGGTLSVTSAPITNLHMENSGFGTIETIPLPAPFAMAAMGLLSIGGFTSWKRRARG